MTTARDVYDAMAQRYVGFVGTELSSATEGPIDRSLLTAFVELVKRQDVHAGCRRWLRSGASRGLPGEQWTRRRRGGCVPSVAQHRPDLAPTHQVQMVVNSMRFQSNRECSPVLSYWYSIIYTPVELLGASFEELARVLDTGWLRAVWHFKRKVSRCTEKMRSALACRSPVTGTA